MEIKLTFMSGAGNIFTVIDNRTYKISKEVFGKAASILCGGGDLPLPKTEGLIILNKGNDKYHFISEFFNPDGSNSAMCGNGGRCAVWFALYEHFFEAQNNPIKFWMANSEYSAEFNKDMVRLKFPSPIEIKSKIEVTLNNKIIKAGYVDVGADHLVINFDDFPFTENHELEDFDILSIAPKLRYHPNFMPAGVNVNFYKVANENTILLRTYERGVEGETGACGTGAISTALVSAYNDETGFPVKIIPTSGIPLYVDVNYNISAGIEFVTLEGSAEITGSQTIQIEL
jgi:diaminopimelate epimerase